MTVRDDGLKDWAQSTGSFAKRTLREIATVNPREWSPSTKVAVWAPTMAVAAGAFPHAALMGIKHPIALGALNSALAGGTAGVLTKLGTKALELNRDVQDWKQKRLSGPSPLKQITYSAPPKMVTQPSPAPRLPPLHQAAEQMAGLINPSKPRPPATERAMNMLRKQLPRVERHVERAREKGLIGDYRAALREQERARSIGKKAIRMYGSMLLKPDDNADLKSLIRHCDDLSGRIDAGGVVTKPMTIKAAKPKGSSQGTNKLGHKSNANFDRQNRLAQKMLAAKMGNQGFDVASGPASKAQRNPSQGSGSTPKPLGQKPLGKRVAAVARNMGSGVKDFIIPSAEEKAYWKARAAGRSHMQIAREGIA